SGRPPLPIALKTARQLDKITEGVSVGRELGDLKDQQLVELERVLTSVRARIDALLAAVRARLGPSDAPEP
ncbi:hypothetical protein, partial [Salmonella sp. SAL4446]|uniref:hypothetical protein n=1 Tax=Salmonella sp. SAL4446 TaxID=3159901 RepID=UPI00397B2667